MKRKQRIKSLTVSRFEEKRREGTGDTETFQIHDKGGVCGMNVHIRARERSPGKKSKTA